jgi:Family of unknown function (DUF5675)
MDRLKLKRISSSQYGTLGVLIGTDGWPLAVTLEPQHFIIPNNVFKCIPYFSPSKKRNCFLLENVPNHSYVEVHVGNFLTDTKGCICVAERFSILENQKYILNSKPVFKKLWIMYGQNGFELEVN